MKLSIIISNRNDLVMFNLTLNSALEAIKALNCKAEIVVCDNSEERFHELMRVMVPDGWIRKGWVKLIHQDQPCFTSARMAAAKHATGEYLFCVDSHVLFGHNTLRDSVDFMERKKDYEPLGFAHPPIRWAHQGPAGVKHCLKLCPQGTAWGQWDKVHVKESKIFWKFMPWICRRDWFLNTLRGYGAHSDNDISWGGAEMLQQVKSWMLGYEQWAVPTDPIIHIGPYTPEVVKTGQYKYRTYSKNGNYPHGFGVLLAFYILGGNDGYNHAKLCEDRILARHQLKVDEWWKKAEKVGKQEREWLMARKKYNYLELLKTQPWNN